MSSEENATQPAAAEDPDLPAYDARTLAAKSARELVDLLIRDEDRAPRNLIDECARRGDEMIELLRDAYGAADADDGPVEYDENGDFEQEAGRWWLTLHAAHILGLMSNEASALLLADYMRRISKDDDQDMQDWLAGRWPALFANKPPVAGDALLALAEDRTHDWYIRVEALSARVAYAQRQGSNELERELRRVGEIAANEREQWDMRLFAANLLLDFPRPQYRELLQKLARRQKGLGAVFSSQNVSEALARGADLPPWNDFQSDPWQFYEPQQIAERQMRWAEETSEAEDLDADWLDDDKEYDIGKPSFTMIDQPVVRATPKVGRNDPCPCGSGKKYKKCCKNKYLQ